MDLAGIARMAGLPREEVARRFLALRVAEWKEGDVGFARFCRDVVRIRSKTGEIVPLVLNEAQKILDGAFIRQRREEGWVRLVGCKARRQGFSTLVAARGYYTAALWRYQNIHILSQDQDATKGLFNMVRLMQEQNPFAPSVKTDNAKELEFDRMGSRYVVSTAGKRGGDRGGAVSFMHCSEVAWWENAADHFASTLQSVDEVKAVWGALWREPVDPLPFEKGRGVIEGWASPGSVLVLESTSAGPVGEFHSTYADAERGMGRYRPVFVPWTVTPEYTAAPSSDPTGEEREYQRLHGLSDGQLQWRADKIHELRSPARFRQEYPIDAAEAFMAADLDAVVFPPALVLKARKAWADRETPDAPLILGVDPASGGGDRFAIAARRGSKLLWVRHRNRIGAVEAQAWILDLIATEQPARVAIDRGNVGAAIIDHLRAHSPEVAQIVRSVDFGRKSVMKMADPNRYGPANVRAEIHGRFKKWLEDDGAIPDEADLTADMVTPRLIHRANDWLVESKKDIKARGGRSTDLLDACCLTFAVLEAIPSWTSPTVPKGFGAGSVPSTAAFGASSWMV